MWTRADKQNNPVGEGQMPGRAGVAKNRNGVGRDVRKYQVKLPVPVEVRHHEIPRVGSDRELDSIGETLRGQFSLPSRQSGINRNITAIMVGDCQVWFAISVQ